MFSGMTQTPTTSWVSDTVYRGLGGSGMGLRLGCGVMVKAGRQADHSDYDAPTWSVVHVIAGRGEYLAADGRRYALAPGWCFQRIPGQRHTTRLDPASGWTECFIDLGSDLHASLVRLPFFFPSLPAWDAGLRPELPTRIVALTARVRQADADGLPDLLLELLALARDLFQAAELDDDGRLIQEACRILADSADDRSGLRRLCQRQGLAYERFRKLFVQRLGVPPHRYRIGRRLERACQLLIDSDRPVAAIAEELGYASPFEFSAQFRRHHGLSPLRYRHLRGGGRGGELS